MGLYELLVCFHHQEKLYFKKKRDREYTIMKYISTLNKIWAYFQTWEHLKFKN